MYWLKKAERKKKILKSICNKSEACMHACNKDVLIRKSESKSDASKLNWIRTPTKIQRKRK